MHAAIRYISTSWPPSMRALLLPSAISDGGEDDSTVTPGSQNKDQQRLQKDYSLPGHKAVTTDQGATAIPRLEATFPRA